ncbi:MAG: purine-nucleoside phosphorylase [Clostridia bacterium]|nr:purine-nucleoside phosphorylase [Clostridia bacterium]NCD02457.1 purine-nucleoside phosphorylase [Clostridia bacterium]
MEKAYERLMSCFQCYKKKVTFKPKAALVLGSGLGDYGETIQVEAVLDYSDIDGFPVSTVPGHKGRFLFGYVGRVPIVAMQGRIHYYEGYSMEEVLLPIRLMKLMGAEVLFLTNASGGVNESFAPGDFMLIKDQISDFVPSPLIGENIDELGERFPDMSHIYDEDLQQIIRDSAQRLGIPLQEGTYLQFSGPNYESPAEIRMSRILGADAVGMSTACEAIGANHMGLRVCGISCISNMAAGISAHPLNHHEVQETAERVAPLFKKLVTETILQIGKIY